MNTRALLGNATSHKTAAASEDYMAICLMLLPIHFWKDQETSVSILRVDFLLPTLPTMFSIKKKQQRATTEIQLFPIGGNDTYTHSKNDVWLSSDDIRGYAVFHLPPGVKFTQSKVALTGWWIDCCCHRQSSNELTLYRCCDN